MLLHWMSYDAQEKEKKKILTFPTNFNNKQGLIFQEHCYDLTISHQRRAKQENQIQAN